MAFGTDTARAGGISSRGRRGGIGGGFRASPTGRSKPSSGGGGGGRIGRRTPFKPRPKVGTVKREGTPTFKPLKTKGEFMIGFGPGKNPLMSHVNVQEGRAGPMIRVRRDDPRAVRANIHQAPPGTFDRFPGVPKRKPGTGNVIRTG